MVTITVECPSSSFTVTISNYRTEKTTISKLYSPSPSLKDFTERRIGEDNIKLHEVCVVGPVLPGTRLVSVGDSSFALPSPVSKLVLASAKVGIQFQSGCDCF